MADWKDMLVDVLRLTDEVKRMNRELERVESTLLGVDKRVVRLETMVEIAQAQSSAKKLDH